MLENTSSISSSPYNKNLILIGGPTASGKTQLSINLAKHYNCPIISADSRQFYREISIGTAKPTKEELSQAEHFLIDSLSIHDDFSIGQYEKIAIKLIGQLHQSHDNVIVVGGSGLYLKSLIEGVDTFPKVSKEIKNSVQNWYDSEGLEPLIKELSELDPEYYEIVDINNPHRVIRALSVIKSCGEKFSHFLTKSKVVRPFNTVLIKTDTDRKILYERINQRVDKMLEEGLLEEVKSVYPFKQLNSLNTVGYKELFNYLDGDCTLDFAIDKIKQHTRNYAKRQITWFNNQGDWHPITFDQIRSVVDHIDATIA